MLHDAPLDVHRLIEGVSQLGKAPFVRRLAEARLQPRQIHFCRSQQTAELIVKIARNLRALLLGDILQVGGKLGELARARLKLPLSSRGAAAPAAVKDRGHSKEDAAE